MEQLTAIEEALFKQRDIPYRDLQTKLIPTISPDALIGVRTPALRSYAKQLIREGNADRFLEELPHRFNALSPGPALDRLPFLSFHPVSDGLPVLRVLGFQ